MKNKKQTVIEATNTDSKVELNVSSDTITDMEMSDFEHLSAGEGHPEFAPIILLHMKICFQAMLEMKC